MAHVDTIRPRLTCGHRAPPAAVVDRGDAPRTYCAECAWLLLLDRLDDTG